MAPDVGDQLQDEILRAVERHVVYDVPERGVILPQSFGRAMHELHDGHVRAQQIQVLDYDDDAISVFCLLVRAPSHSQRLD